MGLQSVFKKAAVTITNAFGDVPVIVTYTTYGPKTYDEETDITLNPRHDYPGIKLFLMPFSLSERLADESILPTDLKALVPVLSIPVKPAPSHEMEITTTPGGTFRSGDKFDVMDFTTDPSEAMFTIHIRAVT